MSEAFSVFSTDSEHLDRPVYENNFYFSENAFWFAKKNFFQKNLKKKSRKNQKFRFFGDNFFLENFFQKCQRENLRSKRAVG